LSRPYDDGEFDVDWWPPSFLYVIDSGDDDVDLCQGDSGAPAFSDLGVLPRIITMLHPKWVGVHS
jgi:hypothetical protein